MWYAYTVLTACFNICFNKRTSNIRSYGNQLWQRGMSRGIIVGWVAIYSYHGWPRKTNSGGTGCSMTGLLM